VDKEPGRFIPLERRVPGTVGVIDPYPSFGGEGDWNAGDELIAQYNAQRTYNAMKDVPEGLDRDSYVNVARRMHESAVTQSAFNDLSAAHGREGGYFSEPDSIHKNVKHGMSGVDGSLMPSGKFQYYKDTEPLHNQMWAWQMKRSATDGLDRFILENRHDPALVQKTADFIQSPENARFRGMALRNRALSDDRKVGVDATQRESAEDWARIAVRNVSHYFQKPSGEWFEDFADKALNEYEHPGLGIIREIPLGDRPETVVGPELVPAAHHPLNAMVEHGWGFIGRQVDHFAREPMYLHQYAVAEKAVRPLIEDIMEGGERRAIESEINNVASERAMRAIVPFIHNPQLRSQFDVVTRNLFPFFFAQTQFYKRWSRSFIQNPEGLRRAQLALQGAGNCGFVHKDPNGREYFMYGLTGEAQKALSEVLSPMFANGAVLPINPQLVGHIDSLIPGTSESIMPSVGPFVGITISAAARRFPEMRKVAAATIGEQAIHRPYWEQVMPSTVKRIYDIFGSQDDANSALASNMFGAAQQLYATGHGVPDDATPAQREQFNNRLVNWSRVMLAVKAIFGFGVPSAPQSAFDTKNLKAEMRDFISKFGVTEGTQLFLGLHPDASAYDVFESHGPGGAPGSPPATADAMSMYASNEQFFRDYKTGSIWLLPQTNAAYDQTAYDEAMDLGLRQKKAPQEFLDDFAYARASTFYYAQKDDYEKQLALTASSHGKQVLENQWSQFSTAYQAAYPVFAQVMNDKNGPVKRAESLQNLQVALNDPRAPKGQQTDDVAELVRNYQSYNDYLASIKGTPNVTRVKRAAQTQFTLYAEDFVKNHPGVQYLYNTLIRPDIDPQAAYNEGTSAAQQSAAADQALALARGYGNG